MLIDVYVCLIFVLLIEDEYSFELGCIEMYIDLCLNLWIFVVLGYEGVCGFWDLIVILLWEYVVCVMDGLDCCFEVENMIFDIKGLCFVDWNGVYEVMIGVQIV